MSVRLQKAIAQWGVCSRRKAEDLITEGRVKVNDKVVNKLGSVVEMTDVIKVNNKIINRHDARMVYYRFYKPRGVLTSFADNEGRPTLLEYTKKIPEKLIYSGRLDINSEGLLLLTNDGELIHRMTHPEFKINKVYHARVKGFLDERKLDHLREGIYLDEVKTKEAEIKVIHHSTDIWVLEFILHEGKNRQIRRMCDEVGLQVLRLKRVKIGAITLHGLKPGEIDPIPSNEVRRLKEGLGLK